MYILRAKMTEEMKHTLSEELKETKESEREIYAKSFAVFVYSKNEKMIKSVHTEDEFKDLELIELKDSEAIEMLHYTNAFQAEFSAESFRNALNEAIESIYCTY